MSNKNSFSWRIAQAAEIRWWQRYLGNKRKKEYLDYKANYWKGIIQKLDINIQESDKVLDAGCGPAGIFMAIPNAKITALDPLIDLYSQKIDHFSKQEYPNVTFVNQELEKLSEKNTYDWIICFNAINHVSDMPLCLRNLKEALKPGGTLVLSTDAHSSTFRKKLFRLVPLDILHPQQYSLPDYQNFIEEAGLETRNEILLKKGGIFDYWCFMINKPSNANTPIL